MIEECPTFLMVGEEIKEVYYTTWESGDGKSWNLVGTEVLEVLHTANKLVVETPVGCFEIDIHPVGPGQTITLERNLTDFLNLMECRRPLIQERDHERLVHRQF